MTLTPAQLTVMIINARELNKPEKRSGALKDFQAHKASIVMIQETHFKKGDRPKLSNQHYPQGYFSDYHGRKSRGTAILLNKRVPFQEVGRLTDEEGRFLFLKGKVAGQSYTFATIYAPNRQHCFLLQTLNKLHAFAEGVLILGGDFNVTLDPTWDCSNGTSHTPTQQLHSLNTLIRKHQLVDCWRAHLMKRTKRTSHSSPTRTKPTSE
ncbi:Hypothetical predicted protein [Pelobates cultripes]|uniref:exodeoxyribonuclease III n=1 Tax=Pelobates cultripes TaxID=61616 RepID=A0AAD1T090_PELCU|nr:Hypothetical predicted protein [Pelobates cultripes]